MSVQNRAPNIQINVVINNKVLTVQNMKIMFLLTD